MAPDQRRMENLAFQDDNPHQTGAVPVNFTAIKMKNVWHLPRITQMGKNLSRIREKV
jgi:hypothetical protein